MTASAWVLTDDFRKLAEDAKAKAEGKEALCRDVLLSVSETFEVMARVNDAFERTIHPKFQPGA